MSSAQKVIVINNFLKYQHTENKPVTELAFRSGYWNVFKMQTALENFLIENNIDYKVKDKSDFI